MAALAFLGTGHVKHWLKAVAALVVEIGVIAAGGFDFCSQHAMHLRDTLGINRGAVRNVFFDQAQFIAVGLCSCGYRLGAAKGKGL
jgi:hypothetical protein